MTDERDERNDEPTIPLAEWLARHELEQVRLIDEALAKARAIIERAMRGSTLH